MDARAWGKEEQGVTANGYRFLSEVMSLFWDQAVVMIAPHYEYAKHH